MNRSDAWMIWVMNNLPAAFEFGLAFVDTSNHADSARNFERVNRL
jgi:hypothetical protein